MSFDPGGVVGGAMSSLSNWRKATSNPIQPTVTGSCAADLRGNVTKPADDHLVRRPWFQRRLGGRPPITTRLRWMGAPRTHGQGIAVGSPVRHVISRTGRTGPRMTSLQVRPLGRVTLIDPRVGQIEEWILSGELKVGAKRPSEEQLATQFEVSRPVVREALGRLRERGLLETINGSGTFVRHPPPERLADALLRQLHLASAGPGALADLDDVEVATD